MSRGCSGRRVGVVLVALLALVAAACGSATGGDDVDASKSTTVDDGSASTAGGNPLGEPKPATGTPVVVGLITTGGDCADCSEGGGLEEPAAKATVAWANEYL